MKVWADMHVYSWRAVTTNMRLMVIDLGVYARLHKRVHTAFMDTKAAEQMNTSAKECTNSWVGVCAT